MALMSGEYPVTLDDKGRLSIPARFREGIPDNLLVLTKGIERCIWAFTQAQWEQFSSKLQANIAPMSIKKADMVQHRFLFSTYEAEIDKAGRIAVPQKLRDFAGLAKDCTVISNGRRIELWDVEHYRAYEQASDEQLVDILEEMDSFDV
ncbi:MAG: division/cell wall cluster transcriptional repressor MraZ [Treponema sp.]|jgi:MraZ protein|nr:division/cell wall cluster transcriptional repressor MraZ [Treponema sp.]